jgi:hypothetical protein
VTGKGRVMRDGEAGGGRGAAVGVPRRGLPSRYFTKYQFSGLMLSVVLCGVTPLRLSVISVSW